MVLVVSTESYFEMVRGFIGSSLSGCLSLLPEWVVLGRTNIISEIQIKDFIGVVKCYTLRRL